MFCKQDGGRVEECNNSWIFESGFIGNCLFMDFGGMVIFLDRDGIIIF